MTFRTALIGAGFISDVHAEALRSTPGVQLAAVVDPVPERAEALARKWGIPEVFPGIESLVESGSADVAHVLVPPDLHQRVGEQTLRSGLHTLLEKPLAEDGSGGEALLAAAKEGGVHLGINQNFVFNPAYLRLREIVRSGRLGRLHHVSVTTNLPLRQLGAGQFGHWMFRQPGFILLEQAVHPLSQIVDLCGPAGDLSVLPAPVQELGHHLPFIGTWQIALRHPAVTSDLYLSLGQEFPLWQITAICSDGVVVADVTRNRCVTEDSSRWPDFYDAWLGARKLGGGLRRQGAANALAYVLSTMKLRPRSDPFYLSMRSGIADFYDGLAAGSVRLDGRFGLDLVRLCERIAEAAGVQPVEPVTLRPPQQDWDVTVLGGTGFIGRHLVRELLESGHRVCVMARSGRGLPSLMHDPRVTVVTGDAGDSEALARAIGPARAVVNLVVGASGSTADEIEASMRSTAAAVAAVCIDRGVEILVHASTIAALYLGNAGDTVTGSTPTDPQSRSRGDYSRAKAATELELQRLAREQGLRLCIVRPGVVVGADGLPFHSGLGFFNRTRHCMGWNRGNNPLPFVLADDVATAITATVQQPDVAVGKVYNLVGDVRLTAREYITELGEALERPLQYHGQSVLKLQGVEIGKWLIKLVTGRKGLVFPSFRDLRSRGMAARFDCGDLKRDLDWQPEAARKAFVRRAIAVHGSRRDPQT